jgi:N6-L-threonylcarbamoyladenine synthase
MLILAIETSCDETAMALVEASGGIKDPQFKVLKNIVSSQVALHAPFGGVVPNIAKREHIQNLPIVYRQVLNDEFLISNPETKSKNKSFKIQNSKIDTIAVTVGPGLEPALWTGIGFAKEVYSKLKIQNSKLKLIGVNHMEGHLYSFLLMQKAQFPISNSQFSNAKTFPAIGLVVSGGHTILLLLKSLTDWKKLGETRDDAVGEAFDKVARMLGLPYPGGPEIQKAAVLGNPAAVDFPRPMINDNSPAGEYDFSFSGLKTSVLYYLRDLKLEIQNSKFIHDVAASFQKAAVDVLVVKTARAAKQYKARSIILAGGVAANALLRETLAAKSKELGVNFFAPPMQFNTDNAAMIAAAAYIQILKKKNRRIAAQANLSL